MALILPGTIVTLPTYEHGICGVIYPLILTGSFISSIPIEVRYLLPTQGLDGLLGCLDLRLLAVFAFRLSESISVRIFLYEW